MPYCFIAQAAPRLFRTQVLTATWCLHLATVHLSNPFHRGLKLNDASCSDTCIIMKCRALLHIRKKHNTILRNRRSVDKLMSAMYDRNLANYLVNYIWDITEFVKGHRQGSNA